MKANEQKGFLLAVDFLLPLLIQFAITTRTAIDLATTTTTTTATTARKGNRNKDNNNLKLL